MSAGAWSTEVRETIRVVIDGFKQSFMEELDSHPYFHLPMAPNPGSIGELAFAELEAEALIELVYPRDVWPNAYRKLTLLERIARAAVEPTTG